MDPDRDRLLMVWTHLSEDQADGRACVMCGLMTGTGWGGAIPVGRSETGSQVFACTGRCAYRASLVVIDPEPPDGGGGLAG